MAHSVLTEVEKARLKKEKLKKKLDEYKKQIKKAEEIERLAQQKEVMNAIKTSGFSIDEAIKILQINAKTQQSKENEYQKSAI